MDNSLTDNLPSPNSEIKTAKILLPPLNNEIKTAEILGVTPSALRAWRVKGSPIPWVKIGRCVRYSSDDIAAFIEANKVSNTTEV